MTEIGTCPVCKATLDARPVDREGAHALFACPVCDLQAWNATREADASFYERSEIYVATSIVDWLGWYHRCGLACIPEGTRTLLDIGSADGRFVHAAALNGINARGIDHSSQLVAAAERRYGDGRVSVASIDELSGRGDRFDAVTMFEVIEHVERPLDLLRTACSLLEPGGTLILSTPNRLGLPHPPRYIDTPPNHLTRWSPRSLRYALERAGLSDIKIHLSPAQIALQALILDRTRTGAIVRLLRRRERSVPHATSGNQDIRTFIRVKERFAGWLAWLLVPLAWWYRGGSMVASARRVR